MSLLDTKNAYFDRLFSDPELKWLGQNTNHVPQHPAVAAAMHAVFLVLIRSVITRN